MTAEVVGTSEIHMNRNRNSKLLVLPCVFRMHGCIFPGTQREICQGVRINLFTSLPSDYCSAWPSQRKVFSNSDSESSLLLDKWSNGKRRGEMARNTAWWLLNLAILSTVGILHAFQIILPQNSGSLGQHVKFNNLAKTTPSKRRHERSSSTQVVPRTSTCDHAHDRLCHTENPQLLELWKEEKQHQKKNIWSHNTVSAFICLNQEQSMLDNSILDMHALLHAPSVACCRSFKQIISFAHCNFATPNMSIIVSLLIVRVHLDMRLSFAHCNYALPKFDDRHSFLSFLVNAYM
jgi:hypothetical protein